MPLSDRGKSSEESEIDGNRATEALDAFLDAVLPCAALDRKARAELRHALLERGLTREVTNDLALQARLGDRERCRKAEIRIVGLLRPAVMLQVIGAIGIKIGDDRPGAHPLPERFVQ